MEVPLDHLEFLAQREFVLGCEDVFTEEERALLIRYGCWMSALARKMISPITSAQERFLAVDRGELEPESVFEIAWAKLKARRQFEQQERTGPHYRVFDAGEAWFPRREHWRYK